MGERTARLATRLLRVKALTLGNTGICWDNGKENGNYHLGFRVPYYYIVVSTFFSIIPIGSRRVRTYTFNFRVEGLGFWGSQIIASVIPAILAVRLLTNCPA